MIKLIDYIISLFSKKINKKHRMVCNAHDVGETKQEQSNKSKYIRLEETLANYDFSNIPSIITKSFDSNKKTLLFMDDQPIGVVILNLIFKDIKEKYDYDVREKFNVVNALGPDAGRKTFNFLKDHKVDIAILDISLGEITRSAEGNIIEIDGIDLGCHILHKFPECGLMFATAHSLNKNNAILSNYFNKFKELTGKDLDPFIVFKNDDKKLEDVYNLIRKNDVN